MGITDHAHAMRETEYQQSLHLVFSRLQRGRRAKRYNGQRIL